MMNSKKATNFDEIDQAVKFNEPIAAGDPFFTDFNDVRGSFKERMVFKALNVKSTQTGFEFDANLNAQNKTLLFLGGMRGSGKTSELNKYASVLNNDKCFFCVICNVDEGLDMNDVEYTDILIFQLERLTEELNNRKINFDSEDVLISMYDWFQNRIQETTENMQYKTGVELGASIKTPAILNSLLSLFVNLKASVEGSSENRDVVRRNIKNKFDIFALKFNEFIEKANQAIRKENKGQEILFIIDGLEKTWSADTRKKIIISESNRIQKIKVNTIFTLPIELMKERQKLNMFSSVKSFPFIKIVERNGQKNIQAIEKFREFVYKRIDKSLFENEGVVDRAINLGGGSPRELLRILETAYFAVDDNINRIDDKALDLAVDQLSAETTRYLSKEELEKLNELKISNEQNKIMPYDPVIEALLEKVIVMEYNDGSFLKVNPIVEQSLIYKQYVI